MRTPSSRELLAAWERGLDLDPLRRSLCFLALVLPERSGEELAELSIAERDRHLLDLRARLFGSVLTSVCSCPRCAGKVECVLETSALQLAAPSSGGETIFERAGYRLDFRLPSSADLYAVRGAEDPREALLGRCIVSAAREGTPCTVDQLPAEVTGALVEHMARLDPAADWELVLTCPTCQQGWKASFDIGAFLAEEIDAWARRMLRDVHQLALAYGWSETDILALGLRRRRAYLEMVHA